MRTLVISDLHLGVRSQTDVLRRSEARDILCARLADVDRLVLLGDVMELRNGPVHEALAVAEPALAAIGAALPAGAEVVLLAGNHDHALVADWLESRARDGTQPTLQPEQRFAAADASWVAARLEKALAPANVSVAYPGIWLRDDVYATHGHYLDAHITIPTFERLGIGAMSRLVGPIPQRATADDYEAELAPVYAWIHAVAQRAAPERAAAGSGSATKVWIALQEGGKRGRWLRAQLLRAGFVLAVVIANRLGIGPVSTELGGPALRRAGLAGMGEVARRLQIAPAHLIFGHTHRTGMLNGDHAAEWRTPAGLELHNCGCWMFETHFMGDRHVSSSPYWPGGAIVLDDDDGPPRLERLLADLPAAVLRPRDPA